MQEPKKAEQGVIIDLNIFREGFLFDLNKLVVQACKRERRRGNEEQAFAYAIVNAAIAQELERRMQGKLL